MSKPITLLYGFYTSGATLHYEEIAVKERAKTYKTATPERCKTLGYLEIIHKDDVGRGFNRYGPCALATSREEAARLFQEEANRQIESLHRKIQQLVIFRSEVIDQITNEKGD